MGLAKNGTMGTLNATILGRGVRGGGDVIDSQRLAPVFHRIGNKFTIIGDKDFDREPGLSCHMLMPKFEHGSAIPFASQREAPDVSRKIIDYVHHIQPPRP